MFFENRKNHPPKIALDKRYSLATHAAENMTPSREATSSVDGFGKYDIYAVAGSIYCYKESNVLTISMSFFVQRECAVHPHGAFSIGIISADRYH